MSARTLLARSARRAPTPLRTPARMLSTTAPPPPSSEPAPLSPSSPRAQYHASPSKPPPQEHAPNWLSRYLLGHPDALQKFLKVTGALGLHTPKQRAQRRALAIYDRCCAPRAEQEFDFWRHGEFRVRLYRVGEGRWRRGLLPVPLRYSWSSCMRKVHADAHLQSATSLRPSSLGSQ